MESNSQPVRVMGIDPGFANLGLCVVEFRQNQEKELLFAALVNTAFETEDIISKGKNKGKKRKATVHDDVIRLRHLIDSMAAVFSRYKPEFCATEMVPNVRNFRAMAQLRMQWGAMYALSRIYSSDLVYVTAKEAKKFATGHGEADKSAVIKSIKDIFPGFGWPNAVDKASHIADAIAVALTAATDENVNSRLVIPKSFNEVNTNV